MQIPNIVFEPAAALTWLGFLGGISAFTSVAKCIVLGTAAAITPVPVAITLVVEVVTIAVLFIRGVLAFGLGRNGAGTLVGWFELVKVGVSALADASL